MVPWCIEDDVACRELCGAICDESQAQGARDAAWQQLLVRAAPHVEVWARKSRLLRRTGLTSEDDARAVVVGVIERLSSRGFEALRRFVARGGPARDDGDERDAAVLDRIVRVAQGPEGELDEPSPEEPAREPSGTLFGAWLFAVTRYAAADHVRDRLGWSQDPETRGTKRAVGTGADRLDAVQEPSHRPPLTDYVTLKRVLDEIAAYMRTLPPAMRQALELWLDDLSFEDIAQRLALDGPERARALTRAGQARLRERFRGQWPEIRALGA